MKRPALVLLLAIALAGCATGNLPPPKVEVHVEKVEVAKPCDPKMKAEPTYPDTAAAVKAATDIFELAKLLLAGRELRIAWSAEQKAALDGCRRLPPP